VTSNHVHRNTNRLVRKEATNDRKEIFNSQQVFPGICSKEHLKHMQERVRRQNFVAKLFV